MFFRSYHPSTILMRMFRDFLVNVSINYRKFILVYDLSKNRNFIYRGFFLKLLLRTQQLRIKPVAEQEFPKIQPPYLLASQNLMVTILKNFFTKANQSIISYLRHPNFLNNEVKSYLSEKLNKQCTCSIQKQNIGNKQFHTFDKGTEKIIMERLKPCNSGPQNVHIKLIKLNIKTKNATKNWALKSSLIVRNSRKR